MQVVIRCLNFGQLPDLNFPGTARDMKPVSRILLIISYLIFIAWMFYHADLFEMPDGLHWIMILTGAVLAIVSWIGFQFSEKKTKDPLGLNDDLMSEKPEQISYMVCFAIYALIGLGALWYFAID